MKSHFDINISKPCNENFLTFPQTVKGGFCSSCTKEVIDFSKMNHEEISEYFNKYSSQNTCGRFKVSQIHSSIKPKKRNRFINFIGGLSVMCLALFSFKTSHAQNTGTSTKSNNPQHEDTLSKNEIIVKGTVVTSDDGLPLPGANVLLEGTSIGTITNFDGYFEFPQKLKKGDILMFSYVGLKPQKITVNNTKSNLNIELEVNMDSCEMMLMGKVAIKEVYKSKKRN